MLTLFVLIDAVDGVKSARPENVCGFDRFFQNSFSRQSGHPSCLSRWDEYTGFGGGGQASENLGTD
jgi:hypothetical protein